MSIAYHDGFSADVKLRLEILTESLSVAQVGDKSLILSKANEITCPVDARIVVTVDGEEFPYDVHITQVDGRRVHFF